MAETGWARLRRVSGRCVLLASLALALSSSGAEAQSVPVLIAEFGDESAGPGDIGGAPADVVTDADGNVWVADRTNGQLLKFDYNGSFIAAVGAPAVQQPIGLGASDDGIFVVDAAAGNVKRLDTGGRVLTTYEGSGVEGLNNPQDVAVGPDGTVYISDIGRTVIARFRTSGGKPLKPISDTNLLGPTSLAVDASGRLFVIDSSSRIQRWSADGKLEATFGQATFSGSASGLAVEPDGNVVATDFGAGVVHRFSPDGAVLGTIGAFGLNAGELTAPDGVAVDCRGNIYVADSRNAKRDDGTLDSFETQGKVVKYGDPAAQPPPCVARALPTSGFVAKALDLEVTQGIQTDRVGVPTGAPQVYGAARGDLGLAQGKRTVVRLYASLDPGPPGGLANIPATLSATKVVGDGTANLGPILPDASPAVLRTGLTQVETAQRTDPAGAYTFTLPPSWTEGVVTLTAQVNPAGIGCADQACRDAGRIQLTNIPFQRTSVLDVIPLALTINGHRPPADPATAFADARNLSPMPIHVRPYRGTIDISQFVAATEARVSSCFLDIEFDPLCTEEVIPLGRDEREAFVTNAIREWFDDVNDDPNVLPYGLIDRNGPGGQTGGTQFGDIGDVIGVQSGDIGQDEQAIAHGDVARPRSIIAHELFHAAGLPHAGTDPSCYPDPEDVGEAWPPDEMGQTQGIGLDSTPASGGGRGPYRILAPGLPNGPAQWFDLMSYCPNTSDTPTSTASSNGWISTRNWTRLLAFRQPAGGPRLAVSRQAAGPSIGVAGIVLPGGQVSLTQVGPSPQGGSGPAGATPSGDFVLQARNSAGAVVASAPMRVTTVEVARGGRTQVIAGDVPAGADVQAISIARADGRLLGQRTRSASAPTVRVTAPRGGSKPRGSSLRIAWTANDRDGGDLVAAVDRSLDGGRTWSAIATSVRGTSVTVASGLIPASARARVRVRVNDGFNEGAAMSGVFRSPGAAPLVRISDPVAGRPVAADGQLLLRGDAIDDAGRPLTGRALTWRLGRRVLGRGAAVSATGLPAGRRTITLEARDRNGRRARTNVAVVVTPVTPVFLQLGAPQRVSPRARTVRLRVATNVPARLRVGSTRATVGRKAKRVSVRVRPGAGPLTLTLALSAGGRSHTETVTIPR